MQVVINSQYKRCIYNYFIMLSMLRYYFVYCMSLGEESSDDSSADRAYKSCVLESSGTKVCWYRHLQDVPRGRMPILSCSFCNHL